jgi:hypothetical protein
MNRVKLSNDIVEFLKNFKRIGFKLENEAEGSEITIYDVEHFYFITIDEQEQIYDVVNKYFLLELLMKDLKNNLQVKETEEVDKNGETEDNN